MESKVAIITGGARGIGAACARTMLEAGYHVAVADRDTAAGDAFIREMALPPERLRFYPLDITDEVSVEDAFKKILQEMGGLDILVNNAGITQDALFLRMKKEQWQKVLDVNLTGAFLCTKAVVPYMIRHQGCRIINIASVVGEMGNAGQANYCASKAGLIGFTKSLARELAGRAVTVNAVAPGFIETEMTQHLPEKAREEFLRNIPLGRPGSTGDVANAVLFLASGNAGYITGQVLDVNGGMYM